MHNARIFRSYLLPELVEQREFVPAMTDIQLKGVTVLPLLIRNTSYPLHPWLIKIFTACLDAQNKLLTTSSAIAEWLWSVLSDISRLPGDA